MCPYLPCRDLLLEEEVGPTGVRVLAMVQQMFNGDGSGSVSGVSVQLIQSVAVQELVGHRFQVMNVILAPGAGAEQSSKAP